MLRDIRYVTSWGLRCYPLWDAVTAVRSSRRSGAKSAQERAIVALSAAHADLPRGSVAERLVRAELASQLCLRDRRLG